MVSPELLPSDTRIILKHLQAGQQLTSLIAYANLGVTSIRSHIAVLRSQGLEVVGLFKRDHLGRRYKVYFLR